MVADMSHIGCGISTSSVLPGDNPAVSGQAGIEQMVSILSVVGMWCIV
jgi:hypothetical protein